MRYAKVIYNKVCKKWGMQKSCQKVCKNEVWKSYVKRYAKNEVCEKGMYTTIKRYAKNEACKKDYASYACNPKYKGIKFS